jgi:hypothetical protein
MASAAKVLSSSSFSAAQRVPELRAVPAARQAPRAGTGRFQLVRDVLGGWLLLAAVVVLWTVTWAAVAGPLSPAREAGQRGEVAAVESAR